MLLISNHAVIPETEAPMDRTTWTPLQVAMADYMAADSANHLAANDLADALADLAAVTEDHDKGWATADEVKAASRTADTLAEVADTAMRRLGSARAAYWAVNRLSRKQFADLLGVAPNTLSGYVTRGQAPAPDSPDGERPWWYESTAQAYAAREKRPGIRVVTGG